MKLANINIVTALTLGALLAFSSMGRCQEKSDKDSANQKEPATGKRTARGGSKEMQRIAEQLELTDEQKTKLQPILREQTAKLLELRQDLNLTAEQRREKTRVIRKEYAAKIKPVLSAEQFEQYKKIRAQTRGGAQGGEQSPTSKPQPEP